LSRAHVVVLDTFLERVVETGFRRQICNEGNCMPLKPAKSIKKSRQPLSARQVSGRPRFYTDEQVRDALRRAGGNFTDAAGILRETFGRPVSRKTIARFVDQSLALQTVVGDIQAVQGDFIERQLHKLIEAGNPQAIHFALSTKFKHRGYGKSTEVTGPNGGPVQVARQLPFDFSTLSDKELAVLGRILDKALDKTSGD
jgi:hypothetical protein